MKQAQSCAALQLDNQLCFALHSTSLLMTKAYKPLLQSIGLTYPQYLALLALWERDGQRVSDLGARLFLDSGTLTPLLKRLEAANLVTRTRSAEDERVVHVGLTASGRKLRKKAEGIPAAMSCALGLNGDQIAALRDPLRKVLARLHHDSAGDEEG